MQSYRIGSPAQIREADRIAMEDYRLPGLALMENAGRAAARLALDMIERPREALVVIFCGKGNNGGDGFVVARWLRNAGVEVHVFLTAAVGDIPEDSDAGVNLSVARRMGVPVVEVLDAEGADAADARLPKADLIVDSLLGTGLAGEVREPTRSLIARINAARAPVLAIDTPSGLCGDTGRVLGGAVKADRTATFAAAKRGFFMGQGPEVVGELHVIDIGVPYQALEGLELRAPRT